MGFKDYQETEEVKSTELLAEEADKELTEDLTNKLKASISDYVMELNAEAKKQGEGSRFPYSFSVTYGKVYARVIRTHSGSDSAHCFIVINKKGFTKGDILKTNSWTKPATNFARGNVVDKNYKISMFGAK